MKSYHSQNTSDSEEEYEMSIQETIHCNHCRFKCLDNLILEIHMDKEHTMKCPNCKFTFSDNEKFKKRMSVSHSYLTPELLYIQDTMVSNLPVGFTGHSSSHGGQQRTIVYISMYSLLYVNYIMKYIIHSQVKVRLNRKGTLVSAQVGLQLQDLVLLREAI